MLNALESYHIYRMTKQRLQMNEALTDTYNPIYDVLTKTNSNTHNPTHSRTLYPPHITPPPPSISLYPLAPASPIFYRPPPPTS
jgi:hypothetical protein